MPMYAKNEVDFEHPAKGASHCSQCRHYILGADKCRIVVGQVMPADWCKKFDRGAKLRLFGKRKRA